MCFTNNIVSRKGEEDNHVGGRFGFGRVPIWYCPKVPFKYGYV